MAFSTNASVLAVFAVSAFCDAVLMRLLASMTSEMLLPSFICVKIVDAENVMLKATASG